MDIASRIAAAKTKNANGTIMGMQQMAMNLCATNPCRAMYIPCIYHGQGADVTPLH